MNGARTVTICSSHPVNCKHRSISSNFESCKYSTEIHSVIHKYNLCTYGNIQCVSKTGPLASISSN